MWLQKLPLSLVFAALVWGFTRPDPLCAHHTRGLGCRVSSRRGLRMEVPGPEEGSLWTGPLFLCHGPLLGGVCVCACVRASPRTDSRLWA